MYRSILVPLDGSLFAEEALPLAVKIANLAGASLEILQVHEFYGLHDAYYSWSPYNAEVDSLLRERARAYLDGVACRLTKTVSAPVSAVVVESLIADGIIERVRSKPADLIVLNASDYREIPYRFGVNPVHRTLKRGVTIYQEGRVAGH